MQYIECYANGDLIILAYSFGAVVAIEILAILESKGKSAKVIFIDGAPDMLTDIVRTFFPIDNENLFQILLLQVLMKKYIPYEEILKHRVKIIH